MKMVVATHMYTDAMNYTNGCPQCAIVEGTGRRQKPLLQPIVSERPFQIVGVDIMELPVTTQGNRYAIVFQDLFTKWPLVFPAPDQKAKRIAQLLVGDSAYFWRTRGYLIRSRSKLAIISNERCLQTARN